MPPHAYVVGGMQLFTPLQPLNFETRCAIVAHPCFSYTEACVKPPFLKVWLEAQPPSPLQKKGGGANYDVQQSLESVEKVLNLKVLASFTRDLHHQFIVRTPLLLFLPKRRGSKFSHKQGEFGNLGGVVFFFKKGGSLIFILTKAL